MTFIIIVISCKKWLERLFDYVVSKEGKTISPNGLRKFLVGRFTNFRIPDGYALEYQKHTLSIVDCLVNQRSECFIGISNMRSPHLPVYQHDHVLFWIHPIRG